MRFGVLGPLTVWGADGLPVRVPERKIRALLADLIGQRGRPVAASRLIDDVWGSELPVHPAAALQTKVSQLRRVLEQAEPGGRGLVVSRPPGYLLRAEPESVDADRFTALVEQARAAGDPRAKSALFAEALGLWRGPAYADFADEEFARPFAQQLEEQRLAALEEHAEVRLDLGEHAELADELGELVRRHPLRERLRAVHLRALYAAGRPAEALAGFADLRARLADELGQDPSPELAALHRAILAQDPALDPWPAGNLPAPVGELLGREVHQAEVGDLLAAHRLVTLTGPGGVGKTRLALAVAARAGGGAPDGVWLAELAGHQGPPATLVATVLDVRDDTKLAEALRAKRLLLVLDNCEHRADEVAGLVRTLLGAAPGLRILATSREPLGLAGEVLYAVPPLDPPSAAELFAVRAGTARTADNAVAVAEICRRLDGLPLALELAATRARALGVHELRKRLDDRFRLLAHGHRGAPARQQTLRAVIDWSWELLTDDERRALRRLAVQADSCGLHVAEAVCGGADVLARLVDKSLVAMIETPSGPRYRLLESVAAYGLERLAEAGEAGTERQRHLDHYLALAEEAEPGLRGAGQRGWLDTLDADAANLRAALDHAVRHGQAEHALRLVNALSWYWFLRGRLREGHRSITAALAVDGPAPTLLWARAQAWQAGFAAQLGDEPGLSEQADKVLTRYDDLDDPPGQARARWFLTMSLIGSGDLPKGAERINRALAGFRALGDRWGVAAALCTRAAQARPRGDLAAARRDAEASAALFADLGDRWGVVKTREVLSSLAEIAGDYPRAAELHREGLRNAEELGMWTEASYQLSGLGRIALLQGDFAAADDFHERARRLAARHSHKRGEQFAEVGLGLSARRQGKLDEADAHLRRWLDWCRRMDGDLGVALILAELGFTAEQRGDVPAALALHAEGLTAARNTGDPRAIALALEGSAGAWALAGRAGHAARLLGAATALREATGAPLPAAERHDVDRIAARLTTALGRHQFQVHFADGRALDPAHAANIPTDPLSTVDSRG
ncbi:BTAD domain-containing putative transcriptional regulator [Amycolatopsis granulosa]|uniref:BTAD domain-containing putative transcriptional regulator n=1 Tax=Amycolatopsis granulosa TaxID=185684 RepID=UPI001420D4B1|nr:putative ATPase/DNA-binding SARP family transcriptional activator [Amycolatopsis granulosa]